MSTRLLSNTNHKAAIRMLLVVGVLIFIYTTLRAYLISITWDEGQTYYEYIKNNIVLIDKYDSISANNHILNTAGGIFFTTIFGISEFTLRITSLIAHLFFLFYSARLVLNFGNKWIALSAFLVLNLNPYLLDFFSLARGYSTSLAFMMTSVYYLYVFLADNYKTRNAIVSILFAEIATLGNLTLLNYFLILYVVILISLLINNKREFKIISLSIKKTSEQMVVPTLLFSAFLIFILPISFKLKEAGALFMGENNGFWKDTVGSIIPRLWYNLDLSDLLQKLTKAVLIVLLFSATAYFIIGYFRKKKANQNKFLGSILFIFYGIILSTITQHYLLGTLYLVERSVLFLFVLLMLIAVVFINELYTAEKKSQWIIHLAALLVVTHFIFSFNLKYVCEWKTDCETKEMLADLERIKQLPTEKFNLSIGIPLVLESSINYYRIVNNLSWLNQATRSKRVNYLNDYFFITPDDFKKENGDSIEVIKTYPVTKNILAKPKYPFAETTTVFDSIIAFQTNGLFKIDGAVEYGPGYNYVFNDSIVPVNGVLSSKIEFEIKRKFTGNVFMITSYENEDGVYEWVRNRVNDFSCNSNHPSVACFTSFIPKTLKAGDRVKVFIWNPNKQELFLKKMELKCLNYKNDY